MIVYHQTDHGEAICQHGFRDGVGHYLTETVDSGVWVSDRRLDANEGTVGCDLLKITTGEQRPHVLRHLKD